MTEDRTLVAGIDVGTECIKAIILDHARTILGRSVLTTQGPFEGRIHEALITAVADARCKVEDLAAVEATGFAANCAIGATGFSSEPACHARGAFHHVATPMTVVDIGGREPAVIQVDDAGRAVESRSARRCAVGIGTFLMFTARHLDIHPSRLEELATAAQQPATIGSYCSVFSNTEILERLREGTSREEIALGCIDSIAERVFEIGGFVAPVLVTGGVAEYFPGVLRALSERTELEVRAVPEPIMACALGAALTALERVRGAR
jgi:predicted CoA-substrate-specific enzyme activase